MGRPGLDFRRLREFNLARSNRWHPRGIDEWSLSDWFTAAAGELGEAGNVIKKLNRDRDGLVGNTQTRAELRIALAEELADVVLYLDLLAARANIDLTQAIVDKFNLVSERNDFPERL